MAAASACIDLLKYVRRTDIDFSKYLRWCSREYQIHPEAFSLFPLEMDIDNVRDEGVAEMGIDNACDESVAEMYKRLKLPSTSRCIRLLHVHARQSHEDANAPIQCDLIVSDLDSQPRFSALSYTWDAASGFKTIMCGDVSVEVTANCVSALQSLRAMHSSLMIWIDAVCINQKNRHEKQHQIELMANIYSKASTTYCWIGEETETTSRVATYMSQAGFLEHFYLDGDPFKRKRLRLTKARHFWIWLHVLRVKLRLSPNPVPCENDIRFSHASLSIEDRINPTLSASERRYSTCTMRELEVYLQCQWIDRIWTYQEVALSSNPVIVRGCTQVSWARFKFSVVFLASLLKHEPWFKWLELVITHSLIQDDMGRTLQDDVGMTSMSDIRDYSNICSSIKIAAYSSVRRFEFLWSTVPKIHLAIATATIGGLYFSCKVDIFYVQLSFALYLFIFARIMRPHTNTHFLKDFMYDDKMESKKLRRFMKTTLCDNILRTLRFRKASEARDLSFGLYSVLDRIPGTAVLPPVDYSLPIGEVFTQLTTYLIAKGSVGAVLELAAHKSYHGSPSWVPDYSQIIETHGDLDYNATGNSRTQCWIDLDNSTALHVYAYISWAITTTVNDPAPGVLWAAKSFEVDTDMKGEIRCKGWSSSAIRAGDRIALISDVSFPVVVRQVATGCFTLISPVIGTSARFTSTGKSGEDRRDFFRKRGLIYHRWTGITGIMHGDEWSRAKASGLVRDITIV